VSASVELRHLSKAFPGPDATPIAVLSDISLTVASGTTTCVIGASGCGKSTLLRIIAGLEREFSGQALLGELEITRPGLDRGFVFQDHRLVPWMTVEDNIAFALRRLPRAERPARVREKLALVGLSGVSQSFPGQLSGGMAQRVALARALSHGPEVLLLDEPFGALDALTRLTLQDAVLKIRGSQNITMIVVTHDIEEAIYLADQIVVLSSRPGRVRACIPIDLPRPRDRADPQFVALRSSIHRRFFSQA
jgi:sulfonate transport system ATP-binding protein